MGLDTPSTLSGTSLTARLHLRHSSQLGWRPPLPPPHQHPTRQGKNAPRVAPPARRPLTAVRSFLWPIEFVRAAADDTPSVRPVSTRRTQTSAENGPHEKLARWPMRRAPGGRGGKTLEQSLVCCGLRLVEHLKIRLSLAAGSWDRSLQARERGQIPRSNAPLVCLSDVVSTA